MRNALLLLLVTLPLAPTLIAQEAERSAAAAEQGMGPPKEQKKFHTFLGHWKGSGTVRQTADAPVNKWTSESSVKNILGGHFVEESARIDLGEIGEGAVLHMKNVMGYSGETKRWMQYGINNLGEVNESEVHWEGTTMITGSATTKYGQLAVERWVTTWHGKDKYSFVGYMSQGSGKTFEHVKGTMERVKITNASFKATKAPAMMPVAEQMAPMHKMAGSYKLKGWMIQMPGTPKIELTATQNFDPIFGGTGLRNVIKGDPIPNMGTYEGLGYTVWNPNKQCYSNLSFTNMGEAMQHDSWLKDGQIVGTMTATQGGSPVVHRSLTNLNDDGTLKSYDGHAIFAAHKPFHGFHCTYTKQ